MHTQIICGAVHPASKFGKAVVALCVLPGLMTARRPGFYPTKAATNTRATDIQMALSQSLLRER
jgi:hypothetical protein